MKYSYFSVSFFQISKNKGRGGGGGGECVSRFKACLSSKDLCRRDHGWTIG